MKMGQDHTCERILTIAKGARGKYKAIVAVVSHLALDPGDCLAALCFIGNLVQPIKQDHALPTCQATLDPPLGHRKVPLVRTLANGILLACI